MVYARDIIQNNVTRQTGITLKLNDKIWSPLLEAAC